MHSPYGMALPLPVTQTRRRSDAARPSLSFAAGCLAVLAAAAAAPPPPSFGLPVLDPLSGSYRLNVSAPAYQLGTGPQHENALEILLPPRGGGGGGGETAARPPLETQGASGLTISARGHGFWFAAEARLRSSLCLRSRRGAGYRAGAPCGGGRHLHAAVRPRRPRIRRLRTECARPKSERGVWCVRHSVRHSNRKNGRVLASFLGGRHVLCVRAWKENVFWAGARPRFLLPGRTALPQR